MSLMENVQAEKQKSTARSTGGRIAVYRKALRMAEVLKMSASWFLRETVLEESSTQHLQRSYQRLTPVHQSVLFILLQELLRLQEGGCNVERSDAGAEIVSESQKVPGDQPKKLLEAEARSAAS